MCYAYPLFNNKERDRPMGKSRKQNRHFMDEDYKRNPNANFKAYRKVRKAAVKGTQVHKPKKGRKWDWHDDLDED